jgi:hypothetical protein
MTPVDELTRDRERLLLNQSAFPRSFVSCSCEQGCVLCAHTGLVSRAEAKQSGDRGPAPTASALRDGCKSSFRWTLLPLLARVPVGAGDDELKRRVWD